MLEEKKVSEVNSKHKIYALINYLLIFSLILALILSFFAEDWINFFISFFTLFLIYFSMFLVKKIKIILPLEFQTIIVAFIFTGLFLGQVTKFYQMFWWWDSAHHLFAGISLSFVGFLILFILFKTEKFSASPFWIAFFSLCFSISIAVSWEMLEFTLDSFFDLNMQYADFSIEVIKEQGNRIVLHDTMWDLILGTAGALIGALMGYFYLIQKNPLFGEFLKKFEEHNPKLFNSKK
jgi:hypothetical protein